MTANLITEDFTGGSNIQAQISNHSSNLCHELNRIYLEKNKICQHSIYEKISTFYDNFFKFGEVLCPSIIQETTRCCQSTSKQSFPGPPKISYIIPLHNCSKFCLFYTIQSLAIQVGVHVTAIIIIDGNSKEDQQAITEILENFRSKLDYIIIAKDINSGVAKARNSGMKAIKTPYFSWLDANDCIHPLRSLHAIILLEESNSLRINTSFSRVSLLEKKIVIRNHQLSQCGQTSFVAKTPILNLYGYLLDLRRHEDTEYQQRLDFFKASMISTTLIGHFLDINISAPKLTHLSQDTWANTEKVDGHSFIAASYSGKISNDRLFINQQNHLTYERILRDIANQNFPCIE